MTYEPTEDAIGHDRDPIHARTGHGGFSGNTRPLRPEPPILVTVEEAARRLSIGRTAAYELVLRGELKSVKIGRTRRVVVASLNDYIARLLEGTE